MSVPHVVFRAEKGPHFSDNNAVMVISLESDGFGIKVASCRSRARVLCFTL